MWSFLRKIFSERESEVTVVVLDENNPDGSVSFKIHAMEVIKLTFIVILVSVFLTTIMFLATPLGSMYQHQQDEQLRQQIVQITDRVTSLQDSIMARDAQLDELKFFLRTANDTTFEIGNRVYADQVERRARNKMNLPNTNSPPSLSQNEIILSGQLDRTSDFPAEFPVEGRLTQGYSVQEGHFGIDIAAASNTNFRALADGTVINANWTITHGQVLFMQHADGIMSVYKHASKLHKKQGDFVLKGDIIGEVGDRGILSSGSHLHLEIWKEGIPQDPLMYLFN